MFKFVSDNNVSESEKLLENKKFITFIKQIDYEAYPNLSFAKVSFTFWSHKFIANIVQELEIMPMNFNCQNNSNRLVTVASTLHRNPIKYFSQ